MRCGGRGRCRVRPANGAPVLPALGSGAMVSTFARGVIASEAAARPLRLWR